MLTPRRVLEVSGHTAKFCDFMVADVKREQFLRADHLLEDWIDKHLAKEGLTADQENELRTDRARAVSFFFCFSADIHHSIDLRMK